MHLPNKKVQETYNKAKGQTFTWSPTRQVFTDQSGNTDYDYSAMLWLKHNRYLKPLPFDKSSTSIVTKFQIVR